MTANQDDLPIIDTDTAIALLEAVVAAYGADHVYEMQGDAHACKYVHDDEPGCIVGAALALHGVPLDVMRPWDTRYPLGKGIANIYDSVSDGGHRLMTRNAADVFRAAQSVQDQVIDRNKPIACGYTWGDALRTARGHAEVFNTP